MAATDREQQILAWIKQNPLISQNELAELCGITRSGVAAHISNLMKKGYIQGKGYIVTPPSYVAVVGAINIDHYGVAMQDVVGESSNMGRIVSSVGGIGYNIAYNLNRLGVPNYLISVYGDDENGERVKQDAYANGIDITHAKQISHMPTSTFLSVVSAQGRQIVGLDDMQISAEITPEFLAQREQTIVNAEMVAIDSSLPSDAIAWVCEKTSRPIFVCVVSVNKAASRCLIASTLWCLIPPKPNSCRGLRCMTRPVPEIAPNICCGPVYVMCFFLWTIRTCCTAANMKAFSGLCREGRRSIDIPMVVHRRR